MLSGSLAGIVPVSPPATGDEDIAATKTKARGPARRGGRFFHRDAHGAARLSPEGGDLPQPRPSAWVNRPIHFNASALKRR